MKMTTQEFLDHLGIEVGKPFMCDGVHTVITNPKGCEYDNLKLFNMEQKDTTPRYLIVGVAWFIDKEITPLPKYTLTEDEKAIVRNMSDKIDFLGKDGVNLYGQIEGREPFWLPFNDVFNFIGQGIKGEVSLDELRKCL